MSEDLFVLNLSIKDKEIVIDLNEVLSLDNFHEADLNEAEIDHQIMRLGKLKMLLKLALEETKAWRRRMENDLEEFRAIFKKDAEDLLLARGRERVELKMLTLSNVHVSKSDVEDVYLAAELPDTDGKLYSPTEYSTMLEDLVKLQEKEGVLQGAYETLCSRSMELLSVAKRTFGGPLE